MKKLINPAVTGPSPASPRKFDLCKIFSICSSSTVFNIISSLNQQLVDNHFSFSSAAYLTLLDQNTHNCRYKHVNLSPPDLCDGVPGTRDIKLSTAGDWAKHLADMLLLTGYNTPGQVRYE